MVQPGAMYDNDPLTTNRTTHFKPIVTLRRSISDPLQMCHLVRQLLVERRYYLQCLLKKFSLRSLRFTNPVSNLDYGYIERMPSEISLRHTSIHVLFLQNDHANHPTEFDARRVRHDRGAQTAAAEAPGSNGRDHGGSGGSLSGWDQILSQASAIGIVYQNSPVRALYCPIFQVSNSQDDHSPDTRLTHCFGQPKEGTSSFSSSQTNRSDSNRYGHSSAKFKGDSQLEAIQQTRHDALAPLACNLTLTPVPEHIVAVTLCFAFCSESQLSIRSNRCNSLTTTYAGLVSADCWPGQIRGPPPN
ncbi:hypothetical protein M9X92_011946 [Pyricularia oryzae]|nr:hypothetical protein M9X92_011946 [Pyricularia oryzae]